MDKINKIKVFSFGKLTEKVKESIEYLGQCTSDFSDIRNVNLKALKNSELLVKDTDIVFVIADIKTNSHINKLQCIIEKSRHENALLILILNVDDKFDGNIISLEKKVDILIPLLEDKVLSGTVDGFFSLSKGTVKENLVEVYLKTLFGFMLNIQNQVISIDNIKEVLKNKGLIYVGYGKAFGQNKSELAAFLAINNGYSLKSIKDSKQVLINISGNEEMGILKVNETAEAIVGSLNKNTEVLIAVTVDSNLHNAVEVSIIGI